MSHVIRGISLVEALVAIVVLAIGMLSMLQYSSNTMLSIDNQTPTAMALKSAAEKIGMLQIDAKNDRTALRNSLNDIYNGGAGKQFTFADNRIYKLEILDARSGFAQNDNVIDSANTQIATDPSVWEPPLSLGVKISFQDAHGAWFHSYTPMTIFFD